MNLAEIYVALPTEVASKLEELLNKIQLPKDPSRDEVLDASSALVIELCQATHQRDEAVLDLIDQLPCAIVDQLMF